VALKIRGRSVRRRWRSIIVAPLDFGALRRRFFGELDSKVDDAG